MPSAPGPSASPIPACSVNWNRNSVSNPAATPTFAPYHACPCWFPSFVVRRRTSPLAAALPRRLRSVGGEKSAYLRQPPGAGEATSLLVIVQVLLSPPCRVIVPLAAQSPEKDPA